MRLGFAQACEHLPGGRPGSWEQRGLWNNDVIVRGEEHFPDHPFISGCVYKGDFKNGKAHGDKGEFFMPDGSLLYRGGWKNGFYSGFGKFSHPSGDTYEGTHFDGLRHGMGTSFDSKDDSSYEGEWFQGAMHGHGTLTKNGFVMEGSFVEGKLAETIQEKALRWYISNVIVKEVVQRYASLMAFQCVSDERDKSEAQDFLVQMGLAKMEVEDDTVAKPGKGGDDAITPHDEGGHPQSASTVPNQISPVQMKRKNVLLKRRARSELREAMRQQEAADEVFRQIMEDREWVEARRAAEMARERAAVQTKQISTEKLRKKKEKKKEKMQRR